MTRAPDAGYLFPPVRYLHTAEPLQVAAGRRIVDVRQVPQAVHPADRRGASEIDGGAGAVIAGLPPAASAPL